jgi:membrane-bound ClpP family serine protease
MLNLIGVRVHPAVRGVIGAVLVILGLVRHNPVPIVVIGAALLVWAGMDCARRAAR